MLPGSLFRLGLALACVSLAHGCSSKRAAPAPVYEEDKSSFAYSFSKEQVNVPTRRFASVVITPEPINYTPCNNSLPGLQEFNKGKIQSFFSGNAADAEPITRSIYPYECPAHHIKDAEGYDVPISLDRPQEQEHTIGLEMERWYDSIVDLVMDEKTSTTTQEWSHAASYFHYKQARRASKCEMKATSLGVVLLSFKTKTILRNGYAKAFEAVEEEYSNLPSKVESDPLPYYKFSEANGIQILRSATLGGRIIINIQRDACQVGVPDMSKSMVFLNTTATIEDMARHLVNKSMAGILSCHADVKGGKTSPDQTVADWMLSVKRKPVVLSGSTDLLSSICDRKSTDPLKARSFERFLYVYYNNIALFYTFSIREFERAHQRYKRVKAVLPILTGPPDIVNAIKQFVDQELEFIIPNNQALSDITNILKQYPNLERNCVRCSRTESENGQDYIRTHTYYLVPNLCTSTVHSKTFKKCQTAIQNLKDTATCIQLYKEQNCTGHGKMFSTVKEGIHEIGSYSSFKPCPFHPGRR